MTAPEAQQAATTESTSLEMYGSAADAAELASRDAQIAAQTAADADVVAGLAAVAASAVASRARDATAAVVATTASAAAEVAAGAAAAVASEAVARAFEAAVSAVQALEAVAAQLPAHSNGRGARRAAAEVASAVADEVIAQAKATADAAATVAAAVRAAADTAALAAGTAAAAVERDAAAGAVTVGDVAESTAATAASTNLAAASTNRVAELTSRLRVVAALRDSEERFSVIFRQSPLGMMLLSLDTTPPGRILQVNPAMVQLTGLSRTNLLHTDWLELVDPAHQQEQAVLLTAMATRAVRTGELVVQWRPSIGRTRSVRVQLHSLFEGESMPRYAVAQVEDITAQERFASTLRAREERFRLAFDNAITGTGFLSLTGEVQRTNAALARFLDTTQDALAGTQFEMLIDRDERKDFRAGIEALKSGASSGYYAEHRFTRSSGGDGWGSVTAALVDGDDGQPDYLVFQVNDVTWRKEAETRLSHQALHDALTGLANRVLLKDRLDQARRRAERDGARIAVLLIDLDDFKDINDDLGHAAGDQVLVDFGERLQRCVGQTDTVGRWAGDEFVILCDNLPNDTDLNVIVDQVTEALADPFSVLGADRPITGSIGIVTDDGTTESDDLVRAADTAMSRAKEKGKNRFEVYGPDMRAAVVRRFALARELEEGLARGELRLHYQAMFSIPRGTVVAVEALLRWEHPTRGLLAPIHFLDIAEGQRLMGPIGEWVLSTAVLQAAAWQRRFGTDSPDMWINISSQQLGRHEFAGVVERVLAASGLAPAKLGLEITERHLVGQAEEIRQDLLEMNELGVRLSVDDFGTGYGSFDYLRRFPIDEIKIDLSFVGGLGRDRIDTAVTSSIVALGRSLDITVVAEGIETQNQYDMLLKMGCDVGQGYLLHRPTAPETLDNLFPASALT